MFGTCEKIKMFRESLNDASPTDSFAKREQSSIENIILSLEKTGKGLTICAVAHAPIYIFSALQGAC
jgi:hypothetical protein